MFKKVFACVMAAVMLICAFSVNSFASVLPDYTRNEQPLIQIIIINNIKMMRISNAG